MVPSNLAIPDRANEEGRQNAAGASGSDSQLLQSQKAVLQRRGGGPEQQSQSHHEKILRLPNLSHYRARALSLTWQATKRFLLTAADDPYLDTEQLHGRLVTVQSSGGTPKLYCATSGKLLGASWAPDGKSIAFIGSREEGTDFYPGGLFVCRGEGSGPEDLAEGSTFAPETFRWMPDSQSLLVSIAEGAHRSLGRISIRDRKVVRLTHPPLEVSHHSDYSISRAGER